MFYLKLKAIKKKCKFILNENWWISSVNLKLILIKCKYTVPRVSHAAIEVLYIFFLMGVFKIVI